MNDFAHYTQPPPDVTTWFQFVLRWTPRAIVAGIAGFYSLGIAYDIGVMAAIDRIAMRILRPSLGYVGLAAIMPTFQWYSAWGVRIACALAAGIIYDLIEKVALSVYDMFASDPHEIHLSPARIHRSPSELKAAPFERSPSKLSGAPLQRTGTT